MASCSVTVTVNVVHFEVAEDALLALGQIARGLSPSAPCSDELSRQIARAALRRHGIDWEEVRTWR